MGARRGDAPKLKMLHGFVPLAEIIDLSNSQAMLSTPPQSDGTDRFYPSRQWGARGQSRGAQPRLCLFFGNKSIEESLLCFKNTLFTGQ